MGICQKFALFSLLCSMFAASTNMAYVAPRKISSTVQREFQASAYQTKDFVNRAGDPAQIDFPLAYWQKNTGGIDGAGLCVFTSICHANGIWCEGPLDKDFLAFMRKKPGGGWPEKVDQMIFEYMQSLNAERSRSGKEPIPSPTYLQIESKNKQEFMDFLFIAIQGGHMVCTTYSFSPSGRYGGGRIAHMVNLVGARVGASAEWCFLDNNYIDPEWMDEATAWKVISGMGGAWAIVFAEPGPPPVPR